MRQTPHCILRPRVLPVPAVAILLLAPALEAQTSRPARLALARPVIVTELPRRAPAPTPIEMLRRASAPPELEGTFTGQYTTSVAPGSVRRAALQVTQGGRNVTGTFVTADGRQADVSGRMDGTRFEATLRFPDSCGGSSRLSAQLIADGQRLLGRLTMSDCHGEHRGEVSLRSSRAGGEHGERTGPRPRGFAGTGQPGGSNRTYGKIAIAAAIDADLARAVAEVAMEGREGGPEFFVAPPPLPRPTSGHAAVLDLTAGSGAGALLLFDIEDLSLDEELRRRLGTETSTRVTGVLYDVRSGVPVWSGASDFVTPASTDVEGSRLRSERVLRAARELLHSLSESPLY